MISHSHRTVFIHIPKCGGQSIESAFLADLGLTWELRAPLLLRPNDQPRIGPPRLAHLLASDYVRYHYLSEELFKSYYTFSVIRDPVARVISMFNYMKIVDARQQPLGFDAFLGEWLPRQLALRSADAVQQYSPASSFYFVRPQVDYITGSDGTLLVRDVFFLEDINDRFAEIQARANLRSSLEHRNKSTATIKRSDLSGKHHEAIGHLYRDDFSFIATLRPPHTPES